MISRRLACVNKGQVLGWRVHGLTAARLATAHASPHAIPRPLNIKAVGTHKLSPPPSRPSRFIIIPP